MPRFLITGQIPGPALKEWSSHLQWAAIASIVARLVLMTLSADLPTILHRLDRDSRGS